MANAVDKNGYDIGQKTFYLKQKQISLAKWIIRPRSNTQIALPLKNTLTPTTSTKDVRGDRWADNAIGSMICKGNEFQKSASEIFGITRISLEGNITFATHPKNRKSDRKSTRLNSSHRNTSRMPSSA